MQIPKVTKLTLKDGDTEILSEELVVLNGMLSQAQKGIDIKDPASAEIWTTRLSEMLREKYSVEVTSTISYLIAVEVTKQMRELEANFTKGL